MTKQDLINAVHGNFKEGASPSKSTIDAVISSLSTVIMEQLAKEEKVVLPNIGIFSAKLRAARKGRNPLTGEEITIPSTVVVQFKAAKKLKDHLN